MVGNINVSYIYPVILLIWGTILGAAAYQYNGQYTPYIIGVCSIAFLFYMEVLFILLLYILCVVLFIVLSFHWGFDTVSVEKIIAILWL